MAVTRMRSAGVSEPTPKATARPTGPTGDDGSPVRYRILGPLEVLDARGRAVELGRPKQRAVLAALLIDAGRVVSVERLLEQLWGEEAAARSMGSLWAYVSNLRRVLEPDRAARDPARLLVTQAPGYVLAVGPATIDAMRFETLAADGHRHLAEGRPDPAKRALDEALALWRGPALAEFAFDDFAVREAARFEELRAVATEDRWTVALALGDHLRAVAGLEAAVAEHPMRERGWELLMVSLYRSGRQGEAPSTYQRVRQLLGEELGLEPGPALRRLEADILAQSPGLDWNPPADERATRPAPLVAEVASPPAHDGFVGREPELGVLTAALEHAAGGRGAIAIVGGEPGVGKTSLVERVAAQASSRGFTVTQGQAEEGDGAPPFWPWIGVIRGLVDHGDPDAVRVALAPGASEIAQVVPEIKELVGDVTPPPSVDAASARFRFYDSVSRFLTGLSQTVPLVVVLDDLHWADPPSLGAGYPSCQPPARFQDAGDGYLPGRRPSSSPSWPCFHLARAPSACRPAGQATGAMGSPRGCARSSADAWGACPGPPLRCFSSLRSSGGNSTFGS